MAPSALVPTDVADRQAQLLTDAQLGEEGGLEVVVAAGGAHKHVGGQRAALLQHCSVRVVRE